MISDTKGTIFSSKKTLNIGGNILDLSTPIVMGVLNATPDSFYKKSRQQTVDDVLKKTEKMLEEGAAIIDIGGYSTRPGAKDISIEEEINRTTSLVAAIATRFPNTTISIDTFRAEVAKSCVSSGAKIVNDISGGSLDPNMLATVADLNVPYILMHMRGNPSTMTQHTTYNNLINDVVDELREKIVQAKAAGIKDIILDPGLGFAKTAEQNFQIIKNLSYFKLFGLPLLIGASRKSMIYKTLETTPEDALNGTTVINTIALMNGAGILRVHDVKEAVETVKLYNKVNDATIYCLLYTSDAADEN